jgi:hypothetical protein
MYEHHDASMVCVNVCACVREKERENATYVMLGEEEAVAK